jgi:hypothetical protein
LPTGQLLDLDFVRFLRERRPEVVPFTGAGVSADAGVPVADKLALLIAEAASELGAEVDRVEDFATVCAAVTDALGVEQLQAVVAGVVSRLEVRPTPLLRSIVRAPSRIVLTSNYDDGLEQAAREVGLTPRTFEPRMAPALGQPAVSEVFVVHIHGIATDPTSIIVPGQPLDSLPEDEAFRLGLRALFAPYTLVYLGYRFPPEDIYLRAELAWLATNLRNTREHALFLPAHEYESRTAELEALREANFTIFTFDGSRSYDAVEQAALVIAPQSQVRTPVVTRRPDREPTQYFRVPSIVRDDPELGYAELQTKIDMAWIGGDDLPFVQPSAIRASGRALVVGEPGSGKTELMLMLGRETEEPNHLYLRLQDATAVLLEEDLERAFLRALGNAAAIVDATPRPTAETVAQNAYVVLLDAFDEVHPDNRVALAERLDALADHWPQHAFIVTTRPIVERELFVSAKWDCYRLLPDARWGADYLRETRGIPQTKIDELFAHFPRSSELIAIPLYAALIGERLAAEAPLPTSALELITGVAVRDALAREAEREGLPTDHVYRFLKTLALAMELRGRNEATVAELRELSAPRDLAADAIREHLIEQALLRDLPDVAQFQAVSVQEALAAEALLETSDPLSAVRTVAVVEVGGEAVLRRDVDHTLDLMFESASAEVRAGLRDLDPLRWARTQPASIAGAEAEETLRFLWRYFTDRNIWIDSDRTRELRDARAAVERLAEAFPEAAIAMRQELLDALTDQEPTTRGNAVFFLDQLSDDDERPGWLLPLLADENTVVRRWTAEVIRRHRVVELSDAVTDAYRADRDELAAEALGLTLLTLAPEDMRGEAAVKLLANPIGWGRLSYTVERLPLPDILTLLEQGDLRRWEDERLLNEILKERPHEEWTDNDAERLVALVVREGTQRHVQVRNPDAIEELAGRYPEAAIRGAAASVTTETLWIDLWFLRSVAREQLEAARSGLLEAPISALLERLDLPAAPVEHPSTPEEVPEPRLAEWIESGKLSEAYCVTNGALIRKFVEQVGDLSSPDRAQLESFARAWWPTVPLAQAARTDGTHGEHHVCLVAALAFHAALGLEIDGEQWLELYEANAIWFHNEAAKWMVAQYPGAGVEGRVAAHVASLRNTYLISIALDCLPEVTSAVAEAAVTAIAQLAGDEAVYLLSRFRDSGQLDALRTLRASSQASEETRRAARQELAAAGDVEAQQEELRAISAAVKAGENFRIFSPDWLSAARAEVIDDIGALFVEVAHRYAPSESDLGRALASALERLADERGVAIYDSLIADSEAIGGSFYWHQRNALIGEIARRDVLERLPEDLPALIETVEGLGYPSREA